MRRKNKLELITILKYANEVVIIYYEDIPISRDEYVKKIGEAVVSSFENNPNAETVTFLKLNKNEYAKWLDGKEDTQVNRSVWASSKINPAKQLQKNNQKLKTCQVCKKEFLGTGKSKFCSNACRQKNKRNKIV